ncbi:type II toxin-antitoxin system RelE/ParE family toxin [Muricauda sp. NFXS6]|uniref:type II toxin-antitoxin system RelE/ParE family toxin n=1 Tax=Allomuricauda sp. NFXS6 TaxID=2819094 RepID=UPI0032DE79B8
MSRKVKISKTAEKKISELLDYLQENWSLKVKSDFVEKLDKSIDLIKSNPKIFPKSDKKSGLHKCVISKQTTLYYQFNSQTIYIVTIFDNRQNPSKLNKEIK